MDKIVADDNRQTIFRKFDKCMEEFFTRATGFCEEADRISRCGENILNVHLSAMKLMLAMNLVREIAERYAETITNSMLDIRLDKNSDYKNRMESELVSFRNKVKRMISAGSLGVNVQEMNEKVNNPGASGESDGAESEDMHLYVCHLTKELDGKIKPICQMIDHTLTYLDSMFVHLTTLFVSRTDDDYRKLFNRSYEQYLASEEWQAYREAFMPNLIERRYDGRKENMTSQSYDDEIEKLISQLCEEDELDTAWTTHRNSAARLGRYFVGLKKKEDRLMRKYFKTTATIDFLREQKKSFEQIVVQVGINGLKDKEVQLVKPFSESLLMDAWDEIYALMEKHKMHKGYKWCCLHHALAFDKRINHVDFKTFMRWLKKLVGMDELITGNNLNQCAKNYFVVTTSQQWSEIKYKEYIESGKDSYKSQYNPKTNSKTFNELFQTAEELRTILRKHS